MFCGVAEAAVQPAVTAVGVRGGVTAKCGSFHFVTTFWKISSEERINIKHSAYYIVLCFVDVHAPWSGFLRCSLCARYFKAVVQKNSLPRSQIGVINNQRMNEK